VSVTVRWRFGECQRLVTNDMLLNSLREHPELAIFLVLAVGFVIGRIRIGSFKVGNVLGTLIAGVLIGNITKVIDQRKRIQSSEIEE